MIDWERVSIESDLDWTELDDYSVMNAIIAQCSLNIK